MGQGRCHVPNNSPAPKDFGGINSRRIYLRCAATLTLMPEDPYWEDEIYRGPTNGPGLHNGPVVVNSLTPSPTTYAINVQSSLSPDSPNGVRIAAGGKVADIPLGVVNAANNQSFFYVAGTAAAPWDRLPARRIRSKFEGTVVVLPPSISTRSLSVLGTAGDYASYVVGSTSTGLSRGINVIGGRNTYGYLRGV